MVFTEKERKRVFWVEKRMPCSCKGTEVEKNEIWLEYDKCPVELGKCVLDTNTYFTEEGKEEREEGVTRKEESMVQEREGSNEQMKAIP